ncbi:VWA domain-containing protein [Psychromonas aquatilis]|uniref:VWA domain-containing protein n=1 Tax=Psychromonas aquatilis TaxID=2005072 RepID=A0ABU9GLY0_9GAMM
MNFNDSIIHNLNALEFLRPYWLIGLAAVLLLNVWHLKGRSKQQTHGIAAHLSEHLVTQAETHKTSRLTLNLIAIIAFIALAGPSIRSVKLPVYQIQKAQVIAFDLSYSMYATDIKPNRLSRAKYKAIDLLNRWTEGDKALIAYAGDAFAITPLTSDSKSIITHINNLSPDLMPVRGSRPDLALDKAISLLQSAGYQEGHIVFITDGFDKNSVDKMQTTLKGSKWTVSVLAVATPEGSTIPTADGSLLRDSNNNIVFPKLQPDTLTPVAEISGGVYRTFDAQGKDIAALADIYKDNGALKKDKDSSAHAENKILIDDGYWLSILLLPLLILLFRKGVFYIALLALTLPLSTPKVQASIWQNEQQNAYQAFQEGDYQSASETFEDQAWKASALFKNKQYEEAELAYKAQQKQQPNDANTLYNLGNTQAIQEKYEAALASYNAALAIDPDFKLAQENKAIVEDLLKKKEEQEQQNQQQDQQSEQQQDQQQDQQSGQQQDQQQNQQSGQQQNQQQDQQSGQQQNQQQDQQSGQQQNQQQDQQSGQQQNQQQDKQSGQQQNQQQDQQSGQQQNQQQDQQSGQQQNQQQDQQSGQQQNQQQDQQSGQQQNQQQDQQSGQQQNQQQQQDQSEPEQQGQQQQQQSAQQALGKAQQQDNAENNVGAMQPSSEENQEYEELPNWLKNMPDDPALLLRNKMRLEYQKRSNNPVQQNNNGEIW